MTSWFASEPIDARFDFNGADSVESLPLGQNRAELRNSGRSSAARRNVGGSALHDPRFESYMRRPSSIYRVPVNSELVVVETLIPQSTSKAELSDSNPRAIVDSSSEGRASLNWGRRGPSSILDMRGRTSGRGCRPRRMRESSLARDISFELLSP